MAAAAGLDEGDLAEGLPVIPVAKGIPPLMVPVRDEAALRRAVRDRQDCDAVCGAADDAESLYLFAVRGEGDVMARMFDLSHRAAGMPGSVTIAQGELAGRPSFLFVEVAPDGDGWTMEVEGGVRRVGEGAFEV